MGTVTYLPCNARTLNAVRSVIGARARVTAASEARRLRAFGRAFRLLADGASSAWATQAGIQELRDVVRSMPVSGDAA